MKQHKFDGVSFVTGLVITAIGLLFLTSDLSFDIFEPFRSLGEWIWPIIAVAVGIAVLVPALARDREGSED